MKIIYLIGCFIIVPLTVFSQQQQHAEANKKGEIKVKQILLNYNTKEFVDKSIFSKLKVNDWVQVVITDIPSDSIICTANAEFGNSNLELKEQFGSFLTFDQQNKYIAATKKDKEVIEQENKKVAEEKDSLIDEKTKKEMQKEAIVRITIEDKNKYKTNETNMIEALDIGNARNYITNNPKGTQRNAALEDIDWQKYLIQVLKENMDKKISYRDSIINVLALKADSGSRKIVTHRHYFMPVKIQNYDYSSFAIRMIDKRSLASEELVIPYINRGGFKLDFSTGFVFNGLTNQNYRLLEYDSNNVQIKRETKDKIPFNTGICLMAHGYMRTGYFVNLAATTGLAYNLNNQNLNFMLGGSILLRADQRFILTFGAMAGRVKELVAYYQTDNPIAKTALPITSDIPFTERLKTSWFIGISYNLGIGGKTKSVKM
jgi:hypothetical protein